MTSAPSRTSTLNIDSADLKLKFKMSSSLWMTYQRLCRFIMSLIEIPSHIDSLNLF